MCSLKFLADLISRTGGSLAVSAMFFEGGSNAGDLACDRLRRCFNRFSGIGHMK